MDTFLEISVDQEWRDETYRWIFGYCLLTLAVVTLVLAAFGGGELLDISILTLVPTIFLLSMYFPCIYNYDIKSDHAHNRPTRRGEGGGACKVTT